MFFECRIFFDDLSIDFGLESFREFEQLPSLCGNNGSY